MVFGKVFGDNFQESFGYVSFHVQAERWVKPYDFSSSLFFLFLVGFLFVLEFRLVAAVFE